MDLDTRLARATGTPSSVAEALLKRSREDDGPPLRGVFERRRFEPTPPPKKSRDFDD